MASINRSFAFSSEHKSSLSLANLDKATYGKNEEGRKCSCGAKAYTARVLFWQMCVCGNNMASAGRELEPGSGGDPVAATWMCDHEWAPQPPRVLTLSSKQRGNLAI